MKRTSSAILRVQKESHVKKFERMLLAQIKKKCELSGATIDMEAIKESKVFIDGKKNAFECDMQEIIAFELKTFHSETLLPLFIPTYNYQSMFVMDIMERFRLLFLKRGVIPLQSSAVVCFNIFQKGSHEATQAMINDEIDMILDELGAPLLTS